jgi:predicted dehydrogenase
MSSTTMEPAIAAPQPPLRVALLGAGIFATTCHAPVIKDNPSVFDCIAVWSRRSESSEALAATLGADTFSGKEGLQQVLQLSKLDAIIMALPLDVQPKYVVMALEAGKNILSEKPIAATVSEAKELQQLYSHKFSGLQWSIAENFRYEPAMMRTAAAVKNEIG